MTGIKEARVFFHSLLILGILLALVSVYFGSWQSSASAQTGAKIVSTADGLVSISVPGAPTTVDLVVLGARSSSDVPGPASEQLESENLSLGSVVFDLSQVDADGVAVDSASFSSPIKVTIQYSDADVAAAHGNPARLSVQRYDSSLGWTALTTSINLSEETLTTYVSTLGLFAVIGQPQPPAPTPTATKVPKAAFVPYSAATEYGVSTAVPPAPTETPIPPTATLLPPTPGDVSPGSNLLVGLFVLAMVMISAGVYQLRHTN